VRPKFHALVPLEFRPRWMKKLRETLPLLRVRRSGPVPPSEDPPEPEEGSRQRSQT
jgi:hypothetical protein